MNKDEFNIHVMCQTLKVSRSGYYRWLCRRDKPMKSVGLREEIKRVFIESRKNYGSPRIY